MSNYSDMVKERFDETSQNFVELTSQVEDIAKVALLIAERMAKGGIVMFCGNGGSAADAQHLAAELQGRFIFDRRPLAAVALTTNTSTLTALGNDYGFDQVFDRQVIGLGKPDDVLIGLSTSGNSSNVIRAFKAARDMGILTIGLTGRQGGKVPEISDICLKVPSDHTARIQEMHIAIGHALCEILEKELM